MRPSIARSVALLSLTFAFACGNAEEEGKAAAQKQASALNRQERKDVAAAVKVATPVPGQSRVPCEQLLDAAAFTEALAEVEPLSIKDTTSSDAEAAASCGLIRGGVRPDQAQQAALIKKQGGRLGTIPGDELCNITAYCWTVEDDVKFKEKCKTDGFQPDDSMGSAACLRIVQQGADDVYTYKFLDADTRCVLKVRGGPSMVDNTLITTCAKAARDLIGKPQITLGGAPAAPAPTDPAAPAPQ